MANLKEIVLTQEQGFVVKETQKPVEIISGNADLRVILGNKAEEGSTIRSIEDSTREAIKDTVRLHGFNQNMNGYILHFSTELNEREYSLPFSAVVYKEK